jgi:hypothetical protein
MKASKFFAPFVIGLAALGTALPANAVISTDVVFIVDESGSMGTVQTNLRNNIGLFASILSGGGVDAKYALVGYGNNLVVPRLLTNFTDASTFATAAQGLLINGGTEPGYTASAFALNALDNQSTLLGYRTNAVKNLIILTDEPSNGDTLARGAVGGLAVTEAILDTLLGNNKALYNAVLSGSSTIASYDDLVLGNGGTIYDLNQFNTTDQAVVQAFVQSFATSKLKEILDFCDLNPTAPECQGTPGSVPVPGTLLLLGIGLAGLGSLRRKFLA